MKKNIVSIIIPVYNVREYLDDCVYSVINQTYKNLEIILVDDGSTDGSGSMCDEYAKLDNRVIVIHKVNGGLSDARNLGLEKTTGNWILFVDSDDYIDEDMVRDMLSIGLVNEADMVICGINILDPPNSRRQCFFESIETECLKNELLDARNGFWMTSWNRICKASLYKDIKFPVGKIHEDEDTTYRLIDRCNKIMGTSKCFYNYRIRSGSIMTHPSTLYNVDLVGIFYNKYQYFKSKKEYKLSEAAFVEYMNTVFISYRYLYKINHPNRDYVIDRMKKACSELWKLHCPFYVKIKWYIYCNLPFVYLLRVKMIN